MARIRNWKVTETTGTFSQLPTIDWRIEPRALASCFIRARKYREGFIGFLERCANETFTDDGRQGVDICELSDSDVNVLFHYYYFYSHSDKNGLTSYGDLINELTFQHIMASSLLVKLQTKLKNSDCSFEAIDKIHRVICDLEDVRAAVFKSANKERGIEQ